MNIECVGCGFTTNVQITKPSAFKCESGVFDCSGCESKIQFVVSHKFGGKKGDVNYKSKVVRISEQLMELLKGENLVSEKVAENPIE